MQSPIRVRFWSYKDVSLLVFVQSCERVAIVPTVSSVQNRGISIVSTRGQDEGKVSTAFVPVSSDFRRLWRALGSRRYFSPVFRAETHRGRAGATPMDHGIEATWRGTRYSGKSLRVAPVLARLLPPEAQPMPAEGRARVASLRTIARDVLDPSHLLPRIPEASRFRDIDAFAAEGWGTQPAALPSHGASGSKDIASILQHPSSLLRFTLAILLVESDMLTSSTSCSALAPSGDSCIGDGGGACMYDITHISPRWDPVS